MHFEWDQKKAKENLRKHGVSFEEAVTAFYDPLSATFDNPDHSTTERRYITIGFSSRNRLLVMHMPKEERLTVLSAQDELPRMRGKDMKARKSRKGSDDLRPEYDFDYSKAVRGKYCQRLIEEGSNVIILDRDIAKAFRDSASVNEALRSLLGLAYSTRRLTKRSVRSAMNPTASR